MAFDLIYRDEPDWHRFNGNNNCHFTVQAHEDQDGLFLDFHCENNIHVMLKNLSLEDSEVMATQVMWLVAQKRASIAKTGKHVIRPEDV